MGSIHRFRMHGINTIVEYPNRIINPIYETHRTSEGYPRWRQRSEEGVDTNWFHLAIPTPQKINGDAIDRLFQIAIHVQQDEGVYIRSIHVRAGQHAPLRFNSPSIPSGVPHWYEIGEHSSDDIDLRSSDAVCISIYVSWNDSDRHFRLFQASAAWED